MSSNSIWKPDSLVTIPARPTIRELYQSQKDCGGRVSLELEISVVKVSQAAIEKAMKMNTGENK